MSQVFHEGDQSDSETTGAILHDATDSAAQAQSSINFEFATHANKQLYSRLDEIIPSESVHALSDLLTKYSSPENAARQILNCIVTASGLVPPTRKEEDENSDTTNNYQLQLNKQLTEAEKYYLTHCLDDKRVINVDAIDELYQLTHDYDDSSTIQMIHYLQTRMPSVAPEHFKDAERIARVMIAREIGTIDI